MKKLLLLLVFIAAAVTCHAQAEDLLPMKGTSAATDTVRVLKDGGSALMLRSTLLGEIDSSFTSLEVDTVSALSGSAVSFGNHLVPLTTATYTLGTASLFWDELFTGVVNVGSTSSYILEDVSNNLVFSDNVLGTRTLTQLAASGDPPDSAWTSITVDTIRSDNAISEIIFATPLEEKAGFFYSSGGTDHELAINSSPRMFSDDGTEWARMMVSAGFVSFRYDSTGTDRDVDISITGHGALKYSDDESALYTQRSIPDVDFVQSEINDSIQDYIANGVEAVPVARNVNAQTGTTYTFALTDRDDIVTFGNGSATTVTVPPNASVAFPIGISIYCIQVGAGTVTFAAGGGVTLNSLRGLASEGQYATFTLIKLATDTWVLNKNTY